LLNIVASEDPVACPKYKCKPKDYKFPDASICMIYNSTDTTYYVNGCDHGYYCAALLEEKIASCTKPLPPVPNTRLPGESCFYAEDCYVNSTCIDGHCKGVQEGYYCYTHEDCDVGLRCNENKCKTQIPAESKGCIDDSDCVNNAGCDIQDLTDPSVNICKNYFTIENYQSVNLNCTTAGEINYMCDSGFCIQQTENSIPQCYPAPKSSKKIPTPCASSNDCSSKIDGNLNLNFTGECMCGLNEKGNSYCDVFPGDSPYDNYAKIIQSWVKSKAILKCNTYARFSLNCMETWWEKKKMDELIYYDYYVDIYSIIHDAEDCVIEAYFSSYWEAKKAYEKENFSSVLGVAVWILFAIDF